MSKLTIAVVFGGTNTEHEVSIVTARSVIKHLDPDKYHPIPIYISKANQWAQLTPAEAALFPAKLDKTLIPSELPQRHVDVVFPVIHGPYGEDGTLQGLLEMLRLPYVGSGVLGSALCMDKVVQKQLCLQQGIKVAPFIWTNQFHFRQLPGKIISAVNHKLRYPLFVKPANQGSSIGVAKIHTAAELADGITQALAYDTKILIEQGIDHAREIECAVLGHHEPQASVVGEINPSNEFYDYDAKYVDGKSQAHIPAHLPAPIALEIQHLAVKAFQVVNCSGLARVDFLVDGSTSAVYLNELNTMPGFTAISMYPKLWAASGLPYSKLLETLIQLALERHQEQTGRQLTYTPKLPWHKQ